MGYVPVAVRRVQRLRQALLNTAESRDMDVTSRDIEYLVASLVSVLYPTDGPELDATINRGRFGSMSRGSDTPGVKTFHVEYLRMMANGLTTEEMASSVHRSQNTVKQNIQRIYRAMGTSDRSHTVAVALVRGIITPDDVNMPEEGFVC